MRWIRDQGGTIDAVGLEAGLLSQWLHRGLSEAGQPVVLMGTRQVKAALKAMPIKTDRRDAEGDGTSASSWLVPPCSLQVEVGIRSSGRAQRPQGAQQGFITLEMSLRGLHAPVHCVVQ